jgi:hypothetical protein
VRRGGACRLSSAILCDIKLSSSILGDRIPGLVEATLGLEEASRLFVLLNER